MSHYPSPSIAQYRADLATARPCILEGYLGRLEGYCRKDSKQSNFIAFSHCGQVSIRINAATVARKYENCNVAEFYYS
jgi:hypothetical protein